MRTLTWKNTIVLLCPCGCVRTSMFFTYITYIIMVYVGHDVAHKTAIVRLIIILYSGEGEGVDGWWHGGRWRAGGYCRRNRKTMFDRKRPLAFSTSTNKHTRFRMVVFKGHGILLGVIHRTVISGGRSIQLFNILY